MRYVWLTAAVVALALPASSAAKAPGGTPSVSTGSASSITSTSATISGTVGPNGRSTTYYFEYGTSTSYGSTTPSQGAGSGRGTVNVSANLTGLSPSTTYDYRLVASNSAGTSNGSNGTFTTSASVPSEQQTNANRAVATYNAMQQYFYAGNVYPGNKSSLYTENYPHSGNTYSYLWPFSRALAGTIALSGVPSALLGGASYQAAVNNRLIGLSRYWDSTSSPPGYDSYVLGPYGGGGDKYYDDAGWVGLAAAQNYNLTGNATSLTDAENVFKFVYPSGWGSNESFDPGGTYWVRQATNHSRTTNSNAPNAEIGLLLDQLMRSSTYDAGASAIYGWANHYLYNVNTNPTDPNAPNPNYDSTRPALMFDGVTTNNTISKALYTYNQGAMIAADVREYQKTGNSAYLQDAEAIANTALSYWTESDYVNSQNAAFNSIFFRGLLVLYPLDPSLQSKITQTIQTYADDVWNNHRNSQGLFSFPTSQGTGYQLLDQGAVLDIFAMLAWNPSEYEKLP